MKRYKFLLTLIFVTFVLLLSACDTTETEETNGSLYIKFINDSTSVVTITSLMTQPMGVAGEANSEPTGDWSGDQLKSDQKVAPGEHIFLTLKIRNTEWVRIRLGVDDGSGREILLHEQPNYQESDISITHWGSDERTFSIEISKNIGNGNYYVSGWMDMAGIEG